MIWPDRAALGLWAILSLGLVMLYANGMIGPVPPNENLSSVLSWVHPSPPSKEPATPAKAVGASPAAPNDMSDIDAASLSDEQVGIAPARKADLGDLASLIILKAGVYCALPIWLVLRVIDFVIGGPMRRQASRN